MIHESRARGMLQEQRGRQSQQDQHYGRKQGRPPPAAQPSSSNSTSTSTSTSRDVAVSNDGIDKRSADYIIRSGLAGGLAGCAAKTIVGPLDRVKILFQTSNPSFRSYSTGWIGVCQAMRDINRADGVRGLFKGHSATLLRIFPYAAIKFLAYEQVRALLIPSKRYETNARRLLSGSLSGMASVFCTYPLEMVRVRLAFETKQGVRSSLRRICREIYLEGTATATGTGTATGTAARGAVARAVAQGSIMNFYRGFLPTIVGMFPYAGMSFLTHDTAGDWLRTPLLQEYTTIPESRTPSRYPEPLDGDRVGDDAAGSSRDASTNPDFEHGHRPQLTAAAELFSGALSGLVAQTCSYPLEVIRRRMQVAGAVAAATDAPAATAAGGRGGCTPRLRNGIAGTARLIYRERGFRGFWVGLTIGYLKIVPMAAAGFYVYERAKWMLGI
ncbi:hypothetical protein KEM52_002204 [Ascosphaera acerosa]|nr:hypothetical protein KEM52_002204 [Ascosphaera acerosa]